MSPDFPILSEEKILSITILVYFTILVLLMLVLLVYDPNHLKSF